jgi:hypothetical protein
MLIAGECLGLGPVQAASAFGYSKQRYFQLRDSFSELGAAALVNHKPGPKGNYRRTNEVVRQVVRHRFLDPQASPAVIALKLRQAGLAISERSVERVITEFGLQKKTLSVQAGHSTGPPGRLLPQAQPRRSLRPSQPGARRTASAG